MLTRLKTAFHQLRTTIALYRLDSAEYRYEVTEREQDDLCDIGGNIARILDLEHEKLRLAETVRQRRHAVNKLRNPT